MEFQNVSSNFELVHRTCEIPSRRSMVECVFNNRTKNLYFNQIKIFHETFAFYFYENVSITIQLMPSAGLLLFAKAKAFLAILSIVIEWTFLEKRKESRVALRQQEEKRKEWIINNKSIWIRVEWHFLREDWQFKWKFFFPKNNLFHHYLFWRCKCAFRQLELTLREGKVFGHTFNV